MTTPADSLPRYEVNPAVQDYGYETTTTDTPLVALCLSCQQEPLVRRTLTITRKGQPVIVCPPPEPKIMCPGCGWVLGEATK